MLVCIVLCCCIVLFLISAEFLSILIYKVALILTLFVFVFGFGFGVEFDSHSIRCINTTTPLFHSYFTIPYNLFEPCSVISSIAPLPSIPGLPFGRNEYGPTTPIFSWSSLYTVVSVCIPYEYTVSLIMSGGAVSLGAGATGIIGPLHMFEF